MRCCKNWVFALPCLPNIDIPERLRHGWDGTLSASLVSQTVHVTTRIFVDGLVTLERFH